ncbi:conserved hypothetical protein [Vibrio harveyi]|nr:conserved hypothetical protein [Vibrio harveyi]
MDQDYSAQLTIALLGLKRLGLKAKRPASGEALVLVAYY